MIGLIGYGRFGRLTVRHLSGDFDVVVHTRSADKAGDIERAGGRLVPLEEACSQKFVIVCVPISAMQPTLSQIAPLLQPNALVADVCSVKSYPATWMREHLPESVEILATHPMFGPDSAAETLKGHKIVLCAERIAPRHYARIKQWLVARGLQLIETTPAEHDRKIAVSLSLTHFLGRTLAKFGATPLDIDTEGYKRLLNILEVVNNDTWQLFEDMHRYNPYAQEKRRAFMDAISAIHGHLEALEKG
ncbi:MAG: prephenate dehydrogenase/arogenate dehydrogenase family protein [Desulfatitalea sp.]|nr:prephenate dehydrogenase/arogenate dehydrogenase family protein [Desulfatitalea sp.]NNK01906.1 prephenate dehydrogenase/arogenate dehydrogenase family protein [Desulfatitalea sp.]